MTTGQHIHISRAPNHDADRVKARLSACTMDEKRRLKRFVCGFCDQSLGQPSCGVYGGAEPCSEDVRIERIESCLATYRPR